MNKNGQTDPLPLATATGDTPALPSNPLTEFERHLSARKIIPENQLRYYMKWAGEFLRTCGGPAKATPDDIPVFAESLRLLPRIQEWQVVQAENAARLLLQMLHPTTEETPLQDRPATTGDSGDDKTDTWEGAIEVMRKRFRVLHYSENTDKTYTPWIHRFREFVDHDGPGESTARDAKDFLTHLALRERVSASAQNQAFNALLYFFRHSLRKDLSGLADTVRARRRKPLPVVLGRDEVRRLLQAMTGTTRLMAQLVYGSGIRSRECVTLRVQDFDFERRQLVVRAGKGDKDRVTLLPRALHEPLRAHLERVRRLHGRDLAEGYGTVWLPDALDRKLPGAPTDWRWQYAFPSSTLAEDERDKVVRRFHMSRDTLRKAIQDAARRAGIAKRVGTHTLRHTFATHLLEDGVNIRIIQDLLGHRHVETTMIYTHVMQKSIDGVRSPLDAMGPVESRGS
jgi:integron integrase